MTQAQQLVYDALKRNIKGNATMADVAKELGMSRAALSTHIRLMEKKGVLKKKRPKLSTWIKLL